MPCCIMYYMCAEFTIIIYVFIKNSTLSSTFCVRLQKLDTTLNRRILDRSLRDVRLKGRTGYISLSFVPELTSVLCKTSLTFYTPHFVLNRRLICPQRSCLLKLAG